VNPLCIRPDVCCSPRHRSSTRIRSLVSGFERHPMTWSTRAISGRPYLCTRKDGPAAPPPPPPRDRSAAATAAALASSSRKMSASEGEPRAATAAAAAAAAAAAGAGRSGVPPAVAPAPALPQAAGTETGAFAAPRPPYPPPRVCLISVPNDSVTPLPGLASSSRKTSTREGEPAAAYRLGVPPAPAAVAHALAAAAAASRSCSAWISPSEQGLTLVHV
jgi:hypothetical protein